ncbi:MAG: hypothetical protein QNJ63_28565 [Calothrix sp. MO_192.B10]|nr:hypothetical protein [Calothrix sp. MO_192.B10]
MSGRYLLDTNIIIALFADEAIIKNNLAHLHNVEWKSKIKAILDTSFLFVVKVGLY